MKEQRGGKYMNAATLKKSIKNSSKNQILMVVQNLIKKRQQHEARIDKLLGPNFLSQDVTQETIKHNQPEFSHLLKQLEQQDKNECQQIQNSIGAFSNHVNLLATVSLKTQYYLAETQPNPVKECGNLVQDLRKYIGKDKITFRFDQENYPEGFSQQILKVIEYVKEEELDEGLFTQTTCKEHDRNEQFFGTRFYLGKYEERQLSKDSLQQQEKQYILKSHLVKNEVNISLLLLLRLLREQKAKCFPQALHLLFSYPIKTFFIQQSLQLIRLSDFIDEFTKIDEEKQSNKCQTQRIKIMGIQQKNGLCNQINTLSKIKKIKHYSQILNQFSKIMIIIQEQLPVKHIPLSCLQNHFVVVTITIKSSGRYYLSMGSNEEVQKFQVYVIDMEGNVIYGQKVLKNEFMFCYLKEDTYQMYIHPIPLNQISNTSEQSFQLVNDHQHHFTLWIQGKFVFQKNTEVNLEIRLREQYNNFTMNIVNTYLKKNFSKEIDYYDQRQSNNQIVIKRQCISRLGLFLDTFIYNQKQSFIVTYKGLYNLTDINFQENQVQMTHGKCLCLYNNCEIQSIRTINSGTETFVKFKLMFFYV